MSNFYADVSGNKTDLDNIFTKKGNSNNNDIVTGFVYNGQDLGERYCIIPSGLTPSIIKDITGQYIFLHDSTEKDFMDIFSQQAIYEFTVKSSNGEESTNNDGTYTNNINTTTRKGLGVTFKFKLMTDISSTFQIGKIDGGNYTDVRSYDNNINVHQNGGKGGDGIVIYMKTSDGQSGNICFIGGGGGAGGFNQDFSNTGDSYTGVDHSPFGKGGNAGTTINVSNDNFDFYYGGEGGNGLENNGTTSTRSGGAGGQNNLNGFYGNNVEKYNGESGYGGSLAFGGGGGGGGFYHGYGGSQGGNSQYPRDSASGGGAGGSKIIKNTNSIFNSNSMQIYDVIVEENIDTIDTSSVVINDIEVLDSKMLNIEETKANNIEANFNTIEYYTS